MKALLIVDVQNGLTKKKTLYNESCFLETINAAIKEYHDLGYPVIFVQHNNKALKFGTSDWKINNQLYRKKEDIVLHKQHGNAFLKTDLKFILDNKKIKEITVCGLVSHGCVKATCIGGLNERDTINLLKNGHTNWNKEATRKIDSTEKELNQIGIKIVSIGKQPPSNESKKDLHEMTTEELGQLFPIIIIEPNKDWEKNFKKEKALILVNTNMTEKHTQKQKLNL
ncbi:isochorismatase family protein [bacterium]|nr:isochorismatase family protein [bacterium]